MSAFDDAIGEMATDLLTEAGDSYTYRDGAGGDTATVTLVKSTPRPFAVDNGNGHVIEVRLVDFKCLTADLPYGNPEVGHRIESGGNIWEVQPPPTSEKCFYQMSPQMTRIHTRLIEGDG